MGAYSDDEGEPLPASQQKNTRPVQLSKPNLSYLVFFFVAGLMTRLYRIDNPHHVVFDEVHFGKFASYYLRHEYFFDVHPPLGKLLIALSGWLVGYDGNYLFDSIGDDYLTVSKEGPVPYQIMRAGPAILGGLIVPIMYLTVIELGGNNVAACIAAFMLLFDNAQITQTRLILLDSYLIFFIAMSLYAYTKFRNQASRAFSASWWLWLFITGISLAGAVSIKLVGLFIIAVVGIHTVYDLWDMYSDVRVPLETVSKHFIARVVGLIAVPVVIVMACFWMHFAVLTHSGPGDTHMSNNFQAGLVGNSLHGSEITQPLDIAYGSIVTIKSVTSKPPCWLHSHRDRYPQYYAKGTSKQRVSSGQQQVTCYPHNDYNNEFMILETDRQTHWHRKAEDVEGENQKHQSRKEAILTARAEQIKRENGEMRLDIPDDYDEEEDEHANVRYVQDGDKIKLLHIATNKLLNSHDVASPMNPSRQEVSGWDSSEKLGGQTEWRIKVKKGKGEGIIPYKTHFQLEHVGTNTVMELSGDKLPEWGYKHAEVVSSKVPVGAHTTWFVDKHINDRLPAVQTEAIPTLSFMEKLIELITEMTEANARLTSKHVFASRPMDWPFLVRGISFYHGDNNQIYLIGNIMGWWVGHILFFLFFAVFLYFFMREARQVYDLSSRQHFALWNAMHVCVLAWVIHYVPFFFMERQLFLHHYLPAMLFVYAVMGIFAEFVLSKLPRLAQIFLISVGVFMTLIIFYLFAPMTYATPANGWEPALKWRRAWDFKGHFNS